MHIHSTGGFLPCALVACLLLSSCCCTFPAVAAQAAAPVPAPVAASAVDDTSPDLVAGELAVLANRLQRLSVALDEPGSGGAGALGPALGGLRPLRRRRRRTYGGGAAAAAYGAPSHKVPLVAVNASPLVASTELNFKGHRLNIITLLNDEFIGATIRNDKQPFQAALLGTLMDLIPPGSTVVDAGANNGMFSAFLAAAVGPTGHVVSFEPQARMFQVLCTNMIVNSLLQIVPKNNALSYKAEVLHMTQKVVDGTSTSRDYTSADKDHAPINYGGMRLGQGGEEVQAITLDSLNLHNVTVIKVDVQGAEQLMFYGARDTIRRNMPVIAYEAVESAMAAGILKDLSLPEEVRTFNVDSYLASLGYTSPKMFEHLQTNGGDKVMLPPGHPWLDKQPLPGNAL